MGTSGIFGFYYKGKYYVCYNHFDSYPSGLGDSLVVELRQVIKNGNIDIWKEMVENLKIISVDSPRPTKEEIEKLAKYTNLSVSSGMVDDWYCLLRNCQGSFIAVLESGYIINHTCEDLPLFEEWNYIVNFDSNKFDVYRGDKIWESYNFNELHFWKLFEEYK